MCLTFESLVSRLVSHLLDRKTFILHFDWRWRFCKAQNLHLQLELKMGSFNMERRTNLETKLHKIRHISRPKAFTSTHKSLFWNLRSQMCMTSPHQKQDAPSYQMIVPRVFKNYLNKEKNGNGCWWLEEGPHTLKTPIWKQSSVIQGKRISALDMCLALGMLVPL